MLVLVGATISYVDLDRESGMFVQYEYHKNRTLATNKIPFYLSISFRSHVRDVREEQLHLSCLTFSLSSFSTTTSR